MKKFIKFVTALTLLLVMIPGVALANGVYVVNATTKATLVNGNSFTDFPIVYGTEVSVQGECPSDNRFFECSYNGSKLLVAKDQLITKERFNMQESSFKLIKELSPKDNISEYKRDSKGLAYPTIETMTKKYSDDPTKKIVDNFYFDSNLTNAQKLDYLLVYLNGEGYTYDFNGSLAGIDKQVSNIANKKTKCFGITYLGAKLLDKMGVPYRVVQVAHYNPNTGKTDYSKSSHIYLEAQLDNGKFVNYDLTDLVLCKCYYKEGDFTQKIFKELQKVDDADNRKEISRMTKSGESTIIIRQSPTFLNGVVQDGNYKIFVKTGLK